MRVGDRVLYFDSHQSYKESLFRYNTKDYIPKDLRGLVCILKTKFSFAELFFYISVPAGTNNNAKIAL